MDNVWIMYWTCTIEKDENIYDDVIITKQNKFRNENSKNMIITPYITVYLRYLWIHFVSNKINLWLLHIRKHVIIIEHSFTYDK